MAYTLYALNFPNGKRYIGITSQTVERRWKAHQRVALRRASYPVYAAIAKYGAENVEPIPLVVGDRDYIASLEVLAISKFRTQDRAFGYNLAPGGDLSPMHSADIAAKVSATKRARALSDPEYAALLQRQVAELHAPEVRARMFATIRTEAVSRAKSEKLTGYKHSAEARARMSEAQSNPNAREMRSAKSRAAWANPDLRAEQSARKKGQVVSAESRAKISASLMGHPGANKGGKQTPEAIAKMKASQLARWERRRAAGLGHRNNQNEGTP